MGTITILGDQYQFAEMPDGKLWILENLKYTGNGKWWNDSPTYSEYGRLYTNAERLSISAMLPAIARVPTEDEVIALNTACSPGSVALKLREVGATHWTIYSGLYGTDDFGFRALGSGIFFGIDSSWRNITTQFMMWMDNGRIAGFLNGSNGNIQRAYADDAVADRYSIRLIIDPPFHGFPGCDFSVGPEWGYEPKIAPSLTWTKTASGLWRCLDDGAAFDAYDGEITVKVSGAVHSAWESFIASNRGAQVTYFAPSGVRPFGPHIDCSAGVQVVIGDGWTTDWRVGVTANCYTLHIPMRYVGGYTPTLATIPAVVARKYPTPTWFYPTKVHATEAGTATAAPRDTETQTTQIIIDNLDPTAAAEMVNWCLYQRGASFTYTPTAGCYPFGVAAGDGPFTVRLIGWSCQKPRPNRWDMTLDMARES